MSNLFVLKRWTLIVKVAVLLTSILMPGVSMSAQADPQVTLSEAPERAIAWTFGQREMWQVYQARPDQTLPVDALPHQAAWELVIRPTANARQLRLTTFSEWVRDRVRLNRVQAVSANVDLVQGEGVSVSLALRDERGETFVLKPTQLQAGENEVLWRIPHDIVNNWGENKNGQIDGKLTLWAFYVERDAAASDSAAIVMLRQMEAAWGWPEAVFNATDGTAGGEAMPAIKTLTQAEAEAAGMAPPGVMAADQEGIELPGEKIWGFAELEQWQVWWEGGANRPFSAEHVGDSWELTVYPGKNDLELPCVSPDLKATGFFPIGNKFHLAVEQTLDIGNNIATGDEAIDAAEWGQITIAFSVRDRRWEKFIFEAEPVILNPTLARQWRTQQEALSNQP